MPYFECHIGHRLALANLETAHFARLEEAMEYALRFLNERAELCRIIAQALHARDEEAADKWEAARRESETRFDELRAIVERDWLRPRQFGPGAGQPAGAEQDSDGG